MCSRALKHKGPIALQAACRMKPGMEGCFELSIANADKGLLSIEEIQRRVAQFTQAGLPLVLTQVGGSTARDLCFLGACAVKGG